MKKPIFILGLILLFSSIILLMSDNIFACIKSLSIILGEPNVLVITADDFYNSNPLNMFVQYLETKGYSVEVKNVSELISLYKPKVYTNYLRITKINDVEEHTSAYFLHFIFYDSDKKLHNFGYWSYITNDFTPHEVSETPTEVMIYTESTLQSGEYIVINYDDNKTITVTFDYTPAHYLNWGYPFITIDGKIHFNETKSYSLWKYIQSKETVEYVILVGDYDLVPSFPFRKMLSGQWTPLESATDHIYGCSVENKYLDLVKCVSRIPVSNLEELETYVNKLINFRFKTSRYSLIVKGNAGSIPQDTWDRMYNELKNDVNNSETKILQELIEPSENEIIEKLNSGNNYAIFFAHGSTVATGVLDVSDFSEIYYKNYTLVFLDSCSTGNFIAEDSIAETFLLDYDSNTFACIAPACVTGVIDICRLFFKNIVTYKNVGETFKIAKNLAKNHVHINQFIYERMNYQLFGDPTIELVSEEITPPPETAWLELSFTVNGNYVTDSALFRVRFPNGTINEYVGQTITIYNCPLGEYYIECIYDGKNQNRTIEITTENGFKICFNFETNKTATLIVKSNIQVIVKVIGPINSTQVTPFVLENVPVGIYILEAYYNYQLVKREIVTLTENEEREVFFTLEIIEEQNDISYFIKYYFPALVMIIALILLFKSK